MLLATAALNCQAEPGGGVIFGRSSGRAEQAVEVPGRRLSLGDARASQVPGAPMCWAALGPRPRREAHRLAFLAPVSS